MKQDSHFRQISDVVERESYPTVALKALQPSCWEMFNLYRIHRLRPVRGPPGLGSSTFSSNQLRTFVQSYLCAQKGSCSPFGFARCSRDIAVIASRAGAYVALYYMFSCNRAFSECEIYTQNRHTHRGLSNIHAPSKRPPGTSRCTHSRNLQCGSRPFSSGVLAVRSTPHPSIITATSSLRTRS